MDDPLLEYVLPPNTLDQGGTTEGNCMTRLYRKLTVALFILIHIIVLSGCIGTMIRPETIEPDWHDKTRTIHPSESDRKSVRDILGEPYASSYYWNIDIFRQSAKQDEIDFFFFFPAWYSYNTIYRYTLVVYDEKDIVNDIDTGLFRSPGLYKIQQNYLSLILNAGNFTYTNHYFGGDGGTLLLDSPTSDAYFQKLHSPTECIAVIGCHKHCSNTANSIHISNSEREVTMWPSSSLLALTLPPGQHEIGVSEKGATGERVESFLCDKGKAVYIGFSRLGFDRYDFWEALASGAKSGVAEFDIEIYDEIPEYFIDFPLIIWRNENWVVNPAYGRFSPDNISANGSDKNQE